MSEVRSGNGWTANDRSVIASYDLPGGRVALRKGDVSVVLLWCANEWHRTVEPLVWPGIWGYAERLVRGSATTVSNHASGTAIDCNAPQHPLGTAITANFSAAEIHAVRRIVAFCEGVIRWGGDYKSRPDGMHLEIVAGAAAVKRIADKIRAGVAPSIPVAPGVAVTTPVQMWTHLVPDYYTADGKDAMWASECLAWGTTHAAHARDAARQALAKVTTLESKVDALLARVAPTPTGPAALSEADVQRIAKAVIAVLGNTPPSGLAQVYEFTGTATPRDPA